MAKPPVLTGRHKNDDTTEYKLYLEYSQGETTRAYRKTQERCHHRVQTIPRVQSGRNHPCLQEDAEKGMLGYTKSGTSICFRLCLIQPVRLINNIVLSGLGAESTSDLNIERSRPNSRKNHLVYATYVSSISRLLDTEDLINDTGELMCGVAASAYFGALLLRRTQELIIDFNAYTEKSFGFESSETSKLQLRLGIKVNIFNQI
ncbi:hypothetical protein RRG08_066594 [Elysia crispata]|uniref:Uncharacterized protein n=1 Tax=Elysia crispata TaxID=231223 RepID=A0AAE0XVJ3_9GAST|nr:hypothetical protein RRG08_066594 [Elysia crispata]